MNIERAAASQKGSEEPHYRPSCQLVRMGLGGSQGDRLASPLSILRVLWHYPIPPGVYLRGRGSRGPMLTQLVREKASGGRGGFQIGLRAAATLTPAEVTAKEPPGLYFNPGSPFS